MSIVYNFDNSQEPKEPFNRTVCPICKQGRQSNAMDVFDCSQCGSTLYCDEKFAVSIRQNNVKLRITNLIYGLLTLLVILVYVILYNIFSYEVIEFLGIFFISSHFAVFIKLAFMKYTQFQGFVDLHKALITFRIRHYDWGSKIFILAILILQTINIFFIMLN